MNSQLTWIIGKFLTFDILTICFNNNTFKSLGMWTASIHSINLYVEHFLMNHTKIFCRFNEFGVDGGPAAKQLKPKFNVFLKHVASQTGFQVPHIEVRSAFHICFA